MLREFVQTIQDLVEDSVKPTIINLDDRTQLIATKNGVQERLRAAPLRRNLAWRIQDLVTAISSFGATDVVVFHSFGLIECELDKGDRRDLVSMPLRVSRPFDELGALSVPRGQKEFVMLLRSAYLDCIPEEFLRIIRAVKFSRQEGGQGNIQNTRESLGKRVEAEVESTVAAIPDTIGMTVPVYLNSDFPSLQPMRFNVVLDVQQQLFALDLQADEKMHAVEAVHVQLHEILEAACSKVEGKEVTVIAGRRTDSDDPRVDQRA